MRINLFHCFTSIWLRPTALALLCGLVGLPALAQQSAQRDRSQDDRTQENRTPENREGESRNNQNRANQDYDSNQEANRNRSPQDQNRRDQSRTDQEFNRRQQDRSATTSNRFDQQTRDQQTHNPSDRQRDPSGRDQYGQPSDRYGQQRDQQSQNREDQGRSEQSRGQQSPGQQSRELSRGSFRERLGIELDQQAQGQSGLSITNIQQGTSAARAGLRSGDVIVSIDGRNIANPNQFYGYLSGQYGRRVPIVIWRGNRQYTVQLTPESQGDTAWLGVYLQDSEDNQGQSGARVTQIYPAGPASRAGLYPGDVITSVDGQQVEGATDLITAIEEQRPGTRVELTVSRNNQQVDVPVTLGSRDSFVYRGQFDDQSGSQSRGGQNARGQDSESGGDDDYFGDVPPYAMQLEHERRMYEQHQRIETEIAKLQDEVRQLRDAIQNLRR